MADRPLVHALGFSPWKRPLVRRFLHGHEVKFVRNARQVPERATLAVWASGPHHGTMADRPDVKRLLLEDGFLRSVGLGAALTAPLSWVVDTRGIYFDASTPSDLEVQLQNGRFDDVSLDRARKLQAMVLTSGLTKYNVGQEDWRGVSGAATAKSEIVLVPGQVETDASIRRGAPGINTNMALLQKVREMHPRAWLIYKPHPDVAAGLRGGGVGESDAHRWCDEIVVDASMSTLLDMVDVVHVMTSLTGFEALLRGKRVVCHGIPFYAGWGLTEDLCPAARRTRRLSIDELVAGALISYPTYVSLTSGQPCSVEQAVSELVQLRSRDKSNSAWWRKAMRPFLRRP